MIVEFERFVQIHFEYCPILGLRWFEFKVNESKNTSRKQRRKNGTKKGKRNY